MKKSRKKYQFKFNQKMLVSKIVSACSTAEIAAVNYKKRFCHYGEQFFRKFYIKSKVTEANTMKLHQKHS